MAGKHSKSFLDLIKNISFKPNDNLTQSKTNVSLLFKIISIFLIASLVASSVFIAVFFVPGKSNQKLLSNAASVFENNGSTAAIKMLSGKNSEIKGWLRIDGTNINNVVCQSSNNSYYINHNHLGKKSRYGALFLSADDTFGHKNNDQNIVVFGNNMKDGTMFGSLKKFRNINFYKQNPVISLYYGKQSESYLVFSVMLISSAADDNNTDFNPTKSFFSDNTEFNKWLLESYQRSIIKTNVEVKYDDKLLTLVTLADDFDGARLVVIAKKIKNEDASYVDTSVAVFNSTIKYPKIWYTTRGLKYPH